MTTYVKQNFQYKVVKYNDSALLEEEVEKLSNREWICQGGVAIDSQGKFCQAMIKNGEVRF